MKNYDELGPYANVLQLGGADGYDWLPPQARDRANAYLKYDQIYWNDVSQYAIRYLDGEFPVYVPNARTIVDTTAHYYLKGLQVNPKNPEKSSKLGEALRGFLRREMFFSRFHTAKHTGVARGDYVFHLTADPTKPDDGKISLTAIHPSKVLLEDDPEDCTRVVEARLIELVPHPDPDKKDQAVKVLRYWYEETGPGEAEGNFYPELTSDDLIDYTGLKSTAPADLGQVTRRVWREEKIFSREKKWWEEDRELLRTTLEPEPLPEPIDIIPVYWFTNQQWDNGPYGFSELRGFERTFQSTSQVVSDQGTSLSLEGLGVYATDGGGPVNKEGQAADWEVGPGKVMEVPAGSYFRRVEGVGSVRPNMDHIEYLESKLREAGGLSDVALGRVDVQTASSGIAMAIKFMPTLAKLDERDKSGIDRLTQLFFDWRKWYEAYEGTKLDEEIEVTIGDKLPTDRTGRINELNNMLDRGVISKQYYRAEMQKLGYEFPEDIEDQIDEEKMKEAEQKAAAAPDPLQQNAVDAASGAKAPPPGNQSGQVTQKKTILNRSNNKSRPNESGGTEANQSTSKQARGGKPTVNARVPAAK